MHDHTKKQHTFQRLRLALGERPRFGATLSGAGVSNHATLPERLSPAIQGPVHGALFARGLHEIVAKNASHHAASFAFALIAAIQHRKQDRRFLVAGLDHNAQENGCLYGAGLKALGLDGACVFQVSARTEKDLLWAIEEGASCAGLAAVIAVLDRKERLYGFAASRRIKLRQEKSAVPVFVVRASYGDATAATTRWLISTRPSQAKRDVPGLPLLGAPRFSAQLIRHLGSPPQTWEIEFDASYGMRLVAEVPDGPIAEEAPIARKFA